MTREINDLKSRLKKEWLKGLDNADLSLIASLESEIDDLELKFLNRMIY
jgi:hypothetical protein